MQPNTGCNARRSSGRRADFLLAALLAVSCAAAAWLLRQEAYWSDGRLLVKFLAQERLYHHHLLYLPVARLLYGALAPTVAADPRQVLELLSAASTGCAAALTYAAARSWGVPRDAAVCGVLLLVSAPVVGFYATCVEVHSLQLAATSATLLWAVRAHRTGSLGRSAIAPAVLLCLLLGTHLSALLVGPALCWLTLRRVEAPRGPRHFTVAVSCLVVFFVVWFLANGWRGAATANVATARDELVSSWNVSRLWNVLVLPAGALYPLALLTALWTLRRSFRAFTGTLPVALLVLVATLLPLAATFPVEERGAYYLWPLPALALCASVLLASTGAWKIPLTAGLLLLHLSSTTIEVRAWAEEYPGNEWITALEEEAGEHALVIALKEMRVIRDHTAIEPIRPTWAVRDEPERYASELVHAIRQALERGRNVALTRSFYESGDFALIVRDLVRRLGPPHEGRHPGYLIYYAPGNARGATRGAAEEVGEVSLDTSGSDDR